MTAKLKWGKVSNGVYYAHGTNWQATRLTEGGWHLKGPVRTYYAVTLGNCKAIAERETLIAAAASEGNAAMLGEQARVDAERQQVKAQRTALRQQANEGR